MLYKNLSEVELCSVMRVRTVLDYVAALKFLVALDVANFKAVLRARTDYRKMRADFKPQREENLRKTTHEPRERFTFSLLWQFYARGKKKFSDLDV
jgi:hypothetical protein